MDSKNKDLDSVRTQNFQHKEYTAIEKLFFGHQLSSKVDAEVESVSEDNSKDEPEHAESSKKDDSEVKTFASRKSMGTDDKITVTRVDYGPSSDASSRAVSNQQSS